MYSLLSYTKELLIVTAMKCATQVNFLLVIHCCNSMPEEKKAILIAGGAAWELPIMIILEGAKATTETVDALRTGASAMKSIQISLQVKSSPSKFSTPISQIVIG
ncbi:uncharacterized protein LOC131221560 isoform X2 [Magnolia sinica]|uniref:uncharacterized protein LOC131221560 isoform X2 n=1 Tax=Magnolia sinica TaxID=86752 RepID=UPI002658058C|nr:uncharacterized protein LOC131221560 isoform X2 [Magnolia sinica]